MGLREQFLATPEKSPEKHHIEEPFNLDVWLCHWSSATRGKVIQIFDNTDELSVAKVVALSACDQDGVLLFSDKDVKDLARKDGILLEKIALRALDLNGLGKNKVEDAKNESGETENSEPV